MTIEQRLEQVEQQNQRIQRTNKRLTVALTMMAVVVCAVVTLAATGLKDGDFDTVTARTIFVENDEGKLVVAIGANDVGDGLAWTQSAKGNDLVMLSSTDNGGMVAVYNKTGERIADVHADDYGNGLVGAYNRKGKGRTLQPGP